MLGELAVGLSKAGCWWRWWRCRIRLHRLVDAVDEKAGFLLEAAADLQGGLAEALVEGFAGLAEIGHHLVAGGIKDFCELFAGAGNAPANVAGDFLEEFGGEVEALAKFAGRCVDALNMELPALSNCSATSEEVSSRRWVMTTCWRPDTCAATRTAVSAKVLVTSVEV